MPQDQETDVEHSEIPIRTIPEGDVYAPVVVAKLSERVTEESVTSESVSIMEVDGAVVPSKASFDPATNLLTVQLLAPLSWMKTYTVTLTTDILDLNDNPLSQNYSWQFSTPDIYTLTVTSIGSGSVAVDPLQDTYLYDDVVTLTATANAGWTFTGWTGDITSTDNPLSVTVESNISVTANFTQNEYSLSVTVDPTGSGSVALDPPQGPYHYGDIVTLTPTANAGYTFSNWTGATVTENQVTITGDTNITANFTQNEYSLSLTVDPTGSGSVLVEPLKDSYHYGDLVTLTPTASPGYTFSSWTGATVTDNQVTIEADTTVTAVFTKDTYGIFLPLILR